MQKPALPANEDARLGTLRSLDILDTPPEERFDRLTRLAKRLFGVPIALVSLVDANRQWFKSCIGLPVSETSREVSFCGHAILADQMLLIPDALLDDRFKDNPLVTGDPKIRFYAGCPLSVGDGKRLGTLCVIDREPRELDAEEQQLLVDLARMAEQELAAVQAATLDELTGLSCRRGFLSLARHAWSWAHRQNVPLTLLYLDLDQFKPINDQFGHAEGDRALRVFSELLTEGFRSSDVLARMGGDEFAVLMTDCTPEQAQPVIDRFKGLLDAHNRKDNRGYDLLCSVGCVSCDVDPDSSIEAWLASADQAMYEVKRQRREAR